MADNISKQITIGVELDTDNLNQNITSLNKTIDTLLAKQQELNASGKQNSAAFIV
jgi:phage-related minor tail protein